jgi:AraC-like DNA-binding protein
MISIQADQINSVKTDSSPRQCISTAGVKPADRREFWQARTGSLCGPFQLEVPGKAAFNATFEYTSLADLLLCRLSSHVPHRAIHTGASARRDDRGFLKAVLQASGCSVLEQNGRETLLRPSEWSIYDTAKPYSLEIPKRAEMFFLMIPRQMIATCSLDLKGLVGRRFSGRHGLGKLIWNLVPTAFDETPAIRAHSSHDVADILAHMVRLALLEASDQCVPSDSKDALRDRVKLYIENHLRDADLSVSKLAHVAHYTKRYLHMAFQQEKVSISAYILRLRLERCLEDLRNPAFVHRSITDIAYSWGFNNSNHFSRCFKEVYGISPRDSRAEFSDLLAHGNGRHRIAS